MRKVIKWAGIVVGSLIVLVLIATAFVYAWSEIRMHNTYQVRVEKVIIPNDQSSIEEGHRLFISRGCSDCHGERAEGKIFLQGGPVGTLAGSNLTKGKGGKGNLYKDDDYVRVIRYGVKHDGKPVIFMPSDEYYGYSDKEIGCIIAFVKQAKPVDNTPSETTPGPVLRALDVFGVSSLYPGLVNINRKRGKDIEAAPTAEYGKVLATGCTGCHGDSFSGGPIPGAPSDLPVPLNITQDTKTGIGTWSYDDFEKALRTGVRPDGKRINEFMPWKNFSKMNKTEVMALWMYLRTVHPKDFGNR